MDLAQGGRSADASQQRQQGRPILRAGLLQEFDDRFGSFFGVGDLLADQHHRFLGVVPFGALLGVQHRGRHRSDVPRPGQVGQGGHRAAADLGMIVRRLGQQQGRRPGGPPGFDQFDPTGPSRRVALRAKPRGNLLIDARIADASQALPRRVADGIAQGGRLRSAAAAPRHRPRCRAHVSRRPGPHGSSAPAAFRTIGASDLSWRMRMAAKTAICSVAAKSAIFAATSRKAASERFGNCSGGRLPHQRVFIGQCFGDRLASIGTGRLHERPKGSRAHHKRLVWLRQGFQECEPAYDREELLEAFRVLLYRQAINAPKKR